MAGLVDEPYRHDRRLDVGTALGCHRVEIRRTDIEQIDEAVNLRRTLTPPNLTPPDFVHKILKYMEKGRVFHDLFGAQS
jgi:hypothetical protein